MPDQLSPRAAQLSDDLLDVIEEFVNTECAADEPVDVVADDIDAALNRVDSINEQAMDLAREFEGARDAGQDVVVLVV